ncbi:MAG: ATP-binding protein [Sutterella wadsworthensis]|nr:ATP-binding protein [Sutterella wadsworthensis]
MRSTGTSSYESKSIVVTSNRPPGEWGLIFQDPTAATAILDRLIHHSTIVTIRGDSYRATQAKKRNVKHSKSKIGASLK